MIPPPESPDALLAKIWEKVQKPGDPAARSRLDEIEKGLALAEEQGLSLWTVRLLSKKARGCLNQSRADDSKQCSVRGWWIARRHGLVEGLIRCLHEMHILRHSQGKFRKAVLHARKAFRLSKSLDDPALLATANLILGTVYYRLGNFEEGYRHLQQSSEIAERETLPVLEGIAQVNMGIAFAELNLFEKSELYFRSALRPLEKAGDERNFLIASLNIAEALNRQKRTEEALEECRRIGERIKKSGIQTFFFTQQVMMSSLSLEMENLEEAERYFASAARLRDQNQSPDKALDFEMCQLSILLKKAEYRKALALSSDLEDSTRKGGNRRRLLRVIKFQSECHEMLGEFESAYRKSKEANTLLEKHHELADKSRMQNLGIIHEVGLKEREIERLALGKKVAEESKRAKQEFLASLTHDLRSPLNGIIGVNCLLKETDLDEEQREYVDLFEKSAELLLSLVNDILDFSKLEAGKLELAPEAVDLLQLLRDCYELFTIQFRKKGISYEFVSGPNVPTTVILDPKRVKEIVINLLSNAYKYTEQGNVTLAASVAEADLQTLEIAVTDTGVGIPEASLSTLFEPFTRVEDQAIRPIVGSGLGLSIVKNLAELMGGEAHVESELGKGSRFRVSIPINA